MADQDGREPPEALRTITLFETLAATAPGAQRDALEAELRRRLANPRQQAAVRNLVVSYLEAAPEYIDERTQALARRLLAESEWSRR
jgi:hypothetical protein